ncbi:MAG TPA: Smr/MutS family protein [Myxococcaceae bacterium]|nr:Smr/MutS family protein [Myxococcaceae bacterium]
MDKRRPPPPPKKKAEGFNTPFKGLKLEKPKPEQKAAPPRPPPQPKKQAPVRLDEEQELFLSAMDGVQAIPNRGKPPTPTPPNPRILDDDAEALARLSELCSGQGPFDVADSDEFIEGSAPDVDKRLMATLRRGEFAVQGHLDLHGMTRQEAREAVEQFLHASRRAGKRCVLLVHGRGLNSKDHIPVLKENLKVWLNRGRIGREVLAFATARPHDGGAGAVYVLLKR